MATEEDLVAENQLLQKMLRETKAVLDDYLEENIHAKRIDRVSNNDLIIVTVPFDMDHQGVDRVRESFQKVLERHNVKPMVIFVQENGVGVEKVSDNKRLELLEKRIELLEQHISQLVALAT